MPWIVGLLAFYAYPLLSSIYYSFTNYNVISSVKWVGLRNYEKLFADKVFWTGITNTLEYAAIAIPTGVVFGVCLALMLNVKGPGRGVLRTLFYLPSLIPVVATAIIWQWLLTRSSGWSTTG